MFLSSLTLSSFSLFSTVENDGDQNTTDVLVKEHFCRKPDAYVADPSSPLLTVCEPVCPSSLEAMPIKDEVLCTVGD
jgi:hypothetical protein